MTLYTQASKNVRRTWLLFSLFFIFIVALGWLFSAIYNSPAILYGAVILSLLLNWVSYWYSDKLALTIAGARPASREEFFDLYTTVENLAITAGLPLPKIYIIPDSAPNAFATGRDKEHAVVAVTSGLLELLNKTELEGVIAHELSHVGNRDILLSTVVVTLVGVISLLADFFRRSMFWGGAGLARRSSDRSEGGGFLIILGVVASILAPIAATLIQLAISRRREFLADASGALLTRYPEGLASALEKISAAGEPLRRASTATAHLFIANPFGPGASRGLLRLFQTHPPVEERIKALRQA
jgi:heat shock protein HtpX